MGVKERPRPADGEVNLALAAPRTCSEFLFGPLWPFLCSRGTQVEHNLESECRDLSYSRAGWAVRRFSNHSASVSTSVK